MRFDSPGLPRLTAPFVVGIFLASVAAATAGPAIPMYRARQAPVEETQPPDKQPLPKLTLGDCLKIAYEKQPKLAALTASVGSANASLYSQEHAPFIVQLTGDHKYRKMQACDGVAAAQAELNQAMYDVTQAVVWTYYSVVYAKEQIKITRDAVDFVDFYRDQVEKIVNEKKGNREINQITANELVARLAEGQRQLLKAQAGHEKAQAALREAMGVEPSYAFEPADAELPDFAKFEIKKDDVIEYARTRRGEVIMASLASEVTRLEAYAQWAIRIRFRAETFASGADIHARTIPSGSKDGPDYRPDAVGPEMPVQLFGDRQSRTRRAWQLVARSEAVLEKTRNLVTLEAESAFIDFFYAGLAMDAAKRQAEAGNRNLMTLKEVAGDRVSTAATLEKLLIAQEQAARGSASYNEAVYQRIAALANIERITAGGVKVNYPGR